MRPKLTKHDHAELEEIRQGLGPTEPVPGPAYAEMDVHLKALIKLINPLLSTAHAGPQVVTAWANLRDLCIEASDVRPLHEKWTNYPKPLSVVKDKTED